MRSTSQPPSGAAVTLAKQAAPAGRQRLMVGAAGALVVIAVVVGAVVGSRRAGGDGSGGDGASASATSITARPPVAKLACGSYTGFWRNDTGQWVASFLGIRFAAQPVRWRASVPPACNPTASFASTTQPPPCNQDYNGPRENETEDCLFLNVAVSPPAAFTPGARAPVLVYFHGDVLRFGWDGGFGV